MKWLVDFVADSYAAAAWWQGEAIADLRAEHQGGEVLRRGAGLNRSRNESPPQPSTYVDAAQPLVNRFAGKRRKRLQLKPATGDEYLLRFIVVQEIGFGVQDRRVECCGEQSGDAVGDMEACSWTIADQTPSESRKRGVGADFGVVR